VVISPVVFVWKKAAGYKGGVERSGATDDQE
jgi:hypothetical protein